MANDLNNNVVFSPSSTQKMLRNGNPFDKIASVQYLDQLAMNKTISEQYITAARTGSYVAGTGAAESAVTTATDQYTIDQAFSSAFSEDEIIEGAQDQNWADRVSEDAGYQLARKTAQWGFAKLISQAPHSLAISGRLTGNILRDALQEANERVKDAEAGQFNGLLYAVYSPNALNYIIEDYVQNNQNEFNDMALREGVNGFIGKKYQGRFCFETNEYQHSLPISFGGSLSDGDIIYLNGGTLTVTFKTTLTGAANEVLIGANATASMTNLRAFINGTSGAGSTYGDMSAWDRAQMQNAGLSLGSGATSATLVKYGRIRATKSGTNITLGTESYSMVVGSREGLIMTGDLTPKYEKLQTATSTGYASHAKTHLFTSRWGGKVPHNAGRSVVVLTGIQY